MSRVGNDAGWSDIVKWNLFQLSLFPRESLGSGRRHKHPATPQECTYEISLRLLRLQPRRQ